jgi:glyoxylase-like metal-dependent hydrolase (beta-lactamase superfamily II)
MKKLTDDVYILDGFPPYAINAYLVGEVLVDARSRHAAKRILDQLKGRTVTTHALTHAHGDHQGSSHEICETLGIPLWCGERDAEAVEDGKIRQRMPRHPIGILFATMFAGPPHPIARRLREGDGVAGFTVLDVPGHSAGHIAFWRESDRTLICGDVFNNMDILTGVPALHEPPSFLSPDPARNRESMRRLAALEPALVCFGHGRPLRAPWKLKAFVEKLPRR